MRCYQSRLHQEERKPSAHGKTMQMQPHGERVRVENCFKVVRPRETYDNDTDDGETEGRRKPVSTARQSEIHFWSPRRKDLQILIVMRPPPGAEYCPLAGRKVDTWGVSSMWRPCPWVN